MSTSLTNSQTTQKTCDYSVVLDAEPWELVELQSMDSTIDFESIVHVAFEKMLYLQSMSFVYDFLSELIAADNMPVIHSTMRQAVTVADYVRHNYNFLVGELVFDSTPAYRLANTHVDVNAGVILLKFEVL